MFTGLTCRSPTSYVGCALPVALFNSFGLLTLSPDYYYWKVVGQIQYRPLTV